MFRKVILVFLLPFIVSARIPPDSKPRHDLYKKIKKVTGVSLKEAYDAVFDKNKIRSRYLLLQVSNQKRMKEIIEGIADEISRHKNICVRKLEKFECEKQIQDLENQQNFIKSLDEKITKNASMKIYKNLLVMSYIVRHDILEPSYKRWSKNCSSQEKVNTKKCKKQFFEIDILYSIVRDLAQASYSKALKQTLPINKDELKSLVSRYD